ncbi:RNA polymerase sigma-70 factor (ECF subfamily) [Arcticibacter tournemirensis]|uniref:RNA polymerase sigma-70 factor n=1 Tax=Arcticibacter tournemirensis TaxID=699437 RepID=A0A5M9HCT2_9SPHI|nr:RNA polymerase sigma-70 factor [Arcticibacter tournemirensis]KAA8483134.1 RNA polymerase sigma-70 factor [Arcticibacter tournemirensis]TQM51951.1 RNA polymerase sigma-70 factor (ECF subfamily) [Arcticibacter tournemirensis]
MYSIKGEGKSREERGGSGNEMDLKSIFDEYYDRLIYFSVQLINNREQAQDIVQEAFVKYWDYRENIAYERCAVKNYLYTTVKHLSFNVLRHNKIVDNYAQKQSLTELADQPVIDAIITSEVLAEIHMAIQSLPENYRIISLKGFLAGKKNHEIADELGMSVNTVKKQKQRALQLLRLKLTSDLFAILLWHAS